MTSETTNSTFNSSSLHEEAVATSAVADVFSGESASTYDYTAENAKWMFLSEVKNDLFRLAKMRQQAKHDKATKHAKLFETRETLKLHTFFSKTKEFDCDSQSFSNNSKDAKKRINFIKKNLSSLFVLPKDNDEVIREAGGSVSNLNFQMPSIRFGEKELVQNLKKLFSSFMNHEAFQHFTNWALFNHRNNQGGFCDEITFIFSDSETQDAGALYALSIELRIEKKTVRGFAVPKSFSGAAKLKVVRFPTFLIDRRETKAFVIVDDDVDVYGDEEADGANDANDDDDDNNNNDENIVADDDDDALAADEALPDIDQVLSALDADDDADVDDATTRVGNASPTPSSSTSRLSSSGRMSVDSARGSFGASRSNSARLSSGSGGSSAASSSAYSLSTINKKTLVLIDTTKLLSQ